MKYYLNINNIAKTPEIEISESEYTALKKAQCILSTAFAIEQKYEIVISNYIEFELKILDITTQNMIQYNPGYSSFFEIINNMNIKLVNLLTAARLYIDQLKLNFPECSPDNDNAKTNINRIISEQYDNNKYYKFMEALRNYVQHYGLPVHWGEFGAHWTSTGDDGLSEYTIEIASDRSKLYEDKMMKKNALSEMEERIDLKIATRSYIESISHIHDLVRNMINATLNSSRKLIEDTHSRYSFNYKGSLVGLRASMIDDYNEVTSIPLLLEWDDVRINMQKRNKKLSNLRKRYVSGVLKKY